ncbi:MAG: thiamine pyrophosphate-binding protein, partial [Bacteroidota bacterium]
MLKMPQKDALPTQTEMISGAEAVMRVLLMEGTEMIFGYPGGAIMPIYDALYDYQRQIRHILVRHEQCAVHSAQGYARASGKMAVVMATSGPGATNLVTGLADAMIDSTPMVCITGQVPGALLGTDAFQESDVISITMPVTKWNFQITDPQEIPEVMAKAFFVAKSGRPGPVLVDITKDAQLKHFEYAGYQPCQKVRSYRPKPIIRQAYITQAAQLIKQAKKPLVIWG